MAENPLSMAFFEAKYRTAPDPWNFAGSPYEQRRYEEIVRHLGHRRFRRAFEPGCSIGILTERLAGICDEVIAVDISPTAMARARVRCAQWPGVSVEAGALPQSIAPGWFDLIVLSEVGYYFTSGTLAALATELASRLVSDGIFIAVHWLGHSDDHVLTGDEVHGVLGANLGLIRTDADRYEGFRIEMWRHR
jgi:SAM-dependent methyltransferase